MLAGAVNSVAGGGTLLTFPALLLAGFPAIIANATSTVALVPGALSSLWGYRKEIGDSRQAVTRLAPPSLVGGVLGAYLLLHTSNKTFEKLVPYLILGATLLFMAQGPLSRRMKPNGKAPTADPSSSDSDVETNARPNAEPSVPSPTAASIVSDERPARVWAMIIGFQFLVGIYGGYFGAGIGILMLAALGFMGFTNIHRMNGLKNINGAIINTIASVIFIFDRLVDWKIAGLMAIGSIVGGYSGAGVARRIGQTNVRRLIIAIGFVLTADRLYALLPKH